MQTNIANVPIIIFAKWYQHFPHSIEDCSYDAVHWLQLIELHQSSCNIQRWAGLFRYAFDF